MEGKAGSQPERSLSRSLVSAFAAVVAIAAVFPSSSVALASGGGDGCNPNRSNNYETFYYNGAYERQPISGVKAVILNYSPYVEPNTDDSSEWVMLDTTNSFYAQIGWYEQPGSKRYTFTEVSTGGPYTDGFYPAEPINSSSTYQVDFTSNPKNPDDAFTYYVNGSLEDNSPDYFTPTQANIDAEIHTQASQMPGGYDNANYVDATSIYLDGGWRNFDGTMQNSNPSWSKSDPANGTIEVPDWTTWDTACAH